MELKGAQRIAAPVETVWAGLFDPEVLQRCLPGCESVTREPDGAYASTLALRIGPVSARFSGRVEMQDVEAPHRCTLVFQGTGGTAGFARGEARLALTPCDGGTQLEYDAAVNVGGRLAQIGARLIDTTAGKLAGQFFDRFRAVFEPAGSDPQRTGAEGSGPQKTGPERSGPAGQAVGAVPGGAFGPAAQQAAAGAGPGLPMAGLPAAVKPADAAGEPEPRSLLAWIGQSKVVWFALGAVLSSAIAHQWLDERALWFVLGAALSYVASRVRV